MLRAGSARDELRTGDALYRLTEVISGTTTTFVYDGDGRRVKKMDESGTTVYVGQHYEVYSSTIERVSVAPDGTEGNGHSYGPSISADGRFVAFTSGADNLVISDTNHAYDTFVHDRQTGETTRVSVASDGTEGNASSMEESSISADGRFVAFHSWATNLVDGDNNGKRDVFVTSNPFLPESTKYYYANGQRIATRVDATLYYVHSDLLGSTVAASDQDGQAVGRVQYDPWGTVITSTLPMALTDRLFTGQRWHGTIGLYQMGARWYDPALGRWIQADTLVSHPLNPQAWNRYSYVLNNSLRYIDPSGHQVVPLLIGLTVATAIWLAYPRIAEAPAPGEVLTPPDYDPGYGGKVFLDSAPGTGDVSDAWAMFTGRRLFTGDPQNPLEAGLFTVLPFVPGGIRSLRHVDEAGDAVRATGQWHHVLSRKIMRALDQHPTLRGVFECDDFRVQALDEASHWGYQTWHRLYDKEAVKWLTENPKATPRKFLEFLKEIYERPEMKKRVPGSLDFLQEALEESQ